MATDLFGKYYNNPTKSSIYTNMMCNNSSMDELSFNISDNEGVISDNNKTLSTIDLSDVNVTMTQYTSDMKTINPFSYIYIKGMYQGDTLMSKFYGKMPEHITDIDGWEMNCCVIFSLKFRDKNGNIKHMVVPVEGDYYTEKTFIDEINEFFETVNIDITSSYNDGYIRFDSTVAGFEFWINHILFTPNISLDYIYTSILLDEELPFVTYITGDNYSKKYIDFNYSTEVCDFYLKLNESIVAESRVYLFEDIKQYIPKSKYRNGAMKGIVMKATYPQFNTDDIYTYQESLQYVHIKDRLEDYLPIETDINNGKDVYVRRLIDVIDSYNPLYDNFYINCSCDCTGCLDNRNEDDIIADIISKDNVIGLDGFVKYAHEKNLWNTVGQFYVRTSVDDIPDDPYCKNYIPSIIIYNPNPFPVIVNYLTFA